jgi:hypothetical protein
MVSRKLLTTNGKITLTIEEAMQHFGRYDVEVVVRGIRGSYSSPDDMLILPFFTGNKQWLCLKDESGIKFKQVWLPPIIDWVVAGDKMAFVVRDNRTHVKFMHFDGNNFVPYDEFVMARTINHHLSKNGVLIATDAFGVTLALLPHRILRASFRGLGKPNDVDVVGDKYAVAFENGVVENVFGKGIYTLVPGPRKIALLDNAIALAGDKQLVISYATGNRRYNLPMHTAKGDFIRTPSNEVILPLFIDTGADEVEVGVVGMDGRYTVINRAPVPNERGIVPRLLDVRYTVSGITFAIDCFTTIVIVSEHGYNVLPVEGTIFDLRLIDTGVAIVGTADVLLTGSLLPKRKVNTNGYRMSFVHFKR